MNETNWNDVIIKTSNKDVKAKAPLSEAEKVSSYDAAMKLMQEEGLSFADAKLKHGEKIAHFDIAMAIVDEKGCSLKDAIAQAEWIGII